MKSFALVPSDNGGCGFYRIIQPGERLAQLTGMPVALIRAGHALPPLTAWRSAQRHQGVKFVVMTRVFEDHQREYWQGFKRHIPDVKLIMEWDDLLWKPNKHSTFKPTAKNLENLDIAAGLADSFVASTVPLADELRKRYGKSVRVLPNMIDDKEFREVRNRKPGEKLRIVWAGSDTHSVDLAQVVDAVKQTAEKYDWNFMGYCPKELTGLVKQHKPQELDKYLMYLDSIQPHVGIAPLHSMAFNRCKSNVKLLEYGALGLATISSDVYPYNPAPSLKVGMGLTSEWISALSKMEDEDFRVQQARDSQGYARRFAISANDELILRAYT